MDAATLAALAIQGIKLANTLLAEVAKVKDSLSSEDEAALKAQLVEFQALNDAHYGRVQDKLADAARQD